MFQRLILAASVAAICNIAYAKPEKGVTLDLLGSFDATTEAGSFDDGAAEIIAHDARGQRLFVINSNLGQVDVLDLGNPEAPARLGQLDVAQDMFANGIVPDAGAIGGVNSVAVHAGLVAVAVEHDDKQASGWVAFYSTEGEFVSAVVAGALPDAVTFTHNGNYLLVANEGEPSDDYQVDPEGSITIVDLRNGAETPVVATADFKAFNSSNVPEGVRISSPVAGNTVAQDLEPEFIATSRDSRTAWVTLQENNAIAEVDIPSATVIALYPLGAKDHSLPGQGLDPSNRDDSINIMNWPVSGLYMPDGMTSYTTRGQTYLVTANEGDGREYIFDSTEEDCPDAPYYEYDDGECIYLDEARVKDIVLDDEVFPNAEYLQENEQLGRLKIVATEGHAGDGVYTKLYSYGARSISIWSASGELVWDSGDIIEQQTALADPSNFNSTNDENGSFDDRSDDKGPEPEGVVVGKVRGKQYAFVGLERVGGVMIFDVTTPEDSQYVGYVNNRNFSVEDVEEDVESAVSTVGDLGPEGLVFIPEEDSPTGEPLLVVGNEISGTTTIYRVVAQ
ncbi:alkaline phosphatase [Parahaliea maris]|uniref:Alkaline phosphatase n=1 Tax=Parahaliea maris TaxID=2716870 RepID=A0A5C8ZL30_9GAMM|nr:choice-of-anchor I family protein [Parahaliea maris]TXS88925.1 alkaline phosphatase [Parahaliea maris]